MSKAGYHYDNAPMERYYNTLKKMLYHNCAILGSLMNITSY